MKVRKVLNVSVIMQARDGEGLNSGGSDAVGEFDRIQIRKQNQLSNNVGSGVRRSIVG